MIKYISKEDLPQVLQDLVDTIGIEAFKKLIENYGGSSLYIPNENSILKPIRNRLIKKHFNGNNYKELAKEFKISEMQVRNIINNVY
ncbi:MAG: DNA-binding protein [Bacilli bacterium]|nr:DNA-binding protein [Bacilli bacterium]